MPLATLQQPPLPIIHVTAKMPLFMVHISNLNSGKVAIELRRWYAACCSEQQLHHVLRKSQEVRALVGVLTGPLFISRSRGMDDNAPLHLP